MESGTFNGLDLRVVVVVEGSREVEDLVLLALDGCGGVELLELGGDVVEQVGDVIPVGQGIQRKDTRALRLTALVQTSADDDKQCGERQPRCLRQ